MKRKLTRRVIFHHSLSTTGDAAVIRSWHLERGFWDIGYHFVIPSMGRSQEGRNLYAIGAHSKGNNSDSIGICLVGNFNKTAPTPCQVCESQYLYGQLCKKFGLLAIEFHHELCPGINLDRIQFIKTLREVL